MKLGKFSISLFLFEALGLIVIFKVFLFVMRNFIFKTAGAGKFEFNESYLNIALFGIIFLLIVRIAYVAIKYKSLAFKKRQPTDKMDDVDITSFVCAECKKPVSEKVRNYCLNHSTKFDGKVYCFEHQKSVTK